MHKIISTKVQGKTCLWQYTIMPIKLFGFSTFYVFLDFWYKKQVKIEKKKKKVKTFKANSKQTNKNIREKFERRVPVKRACEKHMTGSWRVMSNYQFCKYFAGKTFPRDTRETLCLEDFWVWLSYPSPILYIPSLPTKVKEVILERKILDRFSTTHTPIF